MKIRAHAKVNFILNILGKRSDGFHQIETLMHAVSLCDIVELEVFPKGELPQPVTVTLDYGEDYCGPGQNRPPVIDPEDNLAAKAALLMKQQFEIADDISVHITKNIPVAGGLGGGSADAAAVITGMALAYDFTDLNELMKLGTGLGSDVPFCIAAQNGCPAAIATGRGTRLHFIEPLDLAMNISCDGPVIPRKTYSVYRELKPSDYENRYSIEAFLRAGSYEERASLMGNHLQAPAQRLMGVTIPEGSLLCGAGPSMLTLCPEGKYKTVL